ncbi:MAG: aminoglycoside phosphotransferase family protein [Armatimonadota bacterium]|nr:aminoglycoside phosphotransferase family protein [Armatimonadota bacterium]
MNMTVNNHFDRQILVQLITRHIRAHPEQLRFERVPTGHFNTTYFVEGAERPLVLRIAPPDDAGFVFYERGMMAQEPQIHEIVRRRTSVPVPEIFVFDATREYIDRDYLIMEKLPGVPLTQCRVNRPQLDRILHQVGSYLREIHSITSDKYGYLGAHHCMEPQNDWVSAFRVMWNKLVDDVVEAGYYDADEERHMRRLLERYSSVFERPVTSRLLHMDIWAQNILVADGDKVTGILDFDRALWGDKEIEFAVLDYCGISEPAFWEGYGQKRDTSMEALIRRAFYLAYEVQKYIVIRHYRHRDPQSAHRYKIQTMRLLAQLAEIP